MDEKSRPLGRTLTRIVGYVVFLLLVLAVGVAFLAIRQVLDIEWAIYPAAILFGIAAFMLLSLTPFGHRLLPILKLIFPWLGPTIDYLLETEAQRQKYYDSVVRYRSYLYDNDFHTWQPDIDSLQKRVRRAIQAAPGGVTDEQTILLDVLLWMTDTAHREQVADMPDIVRLPENGLVRGGYAEIEDRVRRSFCLVAVAIFITKLAHDLFPLRAEVCRRMSRLNEAVLMTLAYLELKEDKANTKDPGDRDYVTLKELLDSWVEVVVRRQAVNGRGFEYEVNTVREVLGDGEWFTRLWYLLTRTYRNVQDIHGDINDLKDRYPSILNTLKRIFKGLSLETIERFLEARTIDAYLLTFANTQGGLAELIDCLVPGSDCLDPVSVGVERTLAGVQKYVFKSYTPRARIGVVPKGWSFKRFYDGFQADMEALIVGMPSLPLQNTRPLAGVEIILQRFGLRDHYTFESEVDEAKTALARRATLNIRELLADVLDADDFIAVIAYEHEKTRVIDLLMDAAVVELLGDAVVMDPVEQRLVEDLDLELKRSLLVGLGRLGIGVGEPSAVVEGIRTLGRDLDLSPTLYGRAVEQLTRNVWEQLIPALEDAGVPLPPLVEQEAHCRCVSEVYLETLRAIGAIYPS